MEKLATLETTVVNLRKEPYDVYIGRAGHGLDGYFGNPYPLPVGADQVARDECLKKYKRYFWKRVRTDPEFYERVMALEGKTLGCFCKPKTCHGDVIVAFLNYWSPLRKKMLTNK